MTRLATLAERLRSSLWFIPAIFATVAIVLALTTLFIDRELGPEPLGILHFGGSAHGARSVLATIAQSMLTFTALVFTITMLVLQLASSQLSPRVMRTFLRDRGNQVVLGLFVATFLYTLVVLRDVRSAESGAEFVPGFSIFVAFILLIASVAAFIYYINHMAHAIRATAVIESIAEETRHAIDRLFPEGDAATERRQPKPPLVPRADDRAVVAHSAGNVVMLDEDGLVDALQEANTVAELMPTIGDYIPAGAPLFYVDAALDHELADRLRATVTLGSERTLQQDVAFGFRQIVDIAVRALSPGTNDPTTAVQAIDRLHDLLRRIVARPEQRRVYADDDGQPRLAVPSLDWDDYVNLAVDEIRLSGGNQIQVVRRLGSMLGDLATIAPAHRQSVLRHQMAELDRAAAAFDSEWDERRARRDEEV